MLNLFGGGVLGSMIGVFGGYLRGVWGCFGSIVVDFGEVFTGVKINQQYCKQVLIIHINSCICVLCLLISSIGQDFRGIVLC